MGQCGCMGLRILPFYLLTRLGDGRKQGDSVNAPPRLYIRERHGRSFGIRRHGRRLRASGRAARSCATRPRSAGRASKGRTDRCSGLGPLRLDRKSDSGPRACEARCRRDRRRRKREGPARSSPPKSDRNRRKDGVPPSLSRRSAKKPLPLSGAAVNRPDYSFMLLLCPGESFALGSMYTLALLTAVGASPKPTAISLSLPG